MLTEPECRLTTGLRTVSGNYGLKDGRKCTGLSVDCISSSLFLRQHGLGSTSTLLAQVTFVLIQKGVTSG